MELYNICENQHMFRCTIEESRDRYSLRFGGKNPCISISIFKKETGLSPTIDSVGSSFYCNETNTIHMMKICLTFVVWRFPYVRHVQFIDGITKECSTKISIPLLSFHFAKYGKTWYQDHFEAKLANRRLVKYFERANMALEQPYQETFDVFYMKNIMRYEHNMQYIKHDYLKHMLQECWENATTYRDFIKAVSSLDCILLQTWLHPYIMRLIKRYNCEEPWTITAKIIRSWNLTPCITKKRLLQKKQERNGTSDTDLFTMTDFLQKRLLLLQNNIC